MPESMEKIDNRPTISFAPSPIASAPKPMDLADVRQKLDGARGQDYWQSLEEVADAPGFHAMLQREFPGQAPASWAPLERRDFLKLMGASLALAGLAGCATQPQEKIIPFVSEPENVVLGKPLFYATAYPHLGYAHGILAEQNSGRPTKIEGNPDHPVSKGKTDIWTQASVLEMWDPDRSQNVRQNGAESTWEAFTGAVQKVRAQAAASKGAGLHILTGTITSPTLVAQLTDLQQRYPALQVHTWEPAGWDNQKEGVRLATGRADITPVYDFAKADVIVSLDHDFLMEDPSHLIYARDFISRRQVRKDHVEMNRLYVAESTPSITGAKADHRLSLRASQIGQFAGALAGSLSGGFAGELPVATTSKEGAGTKQYLDALVKDLQGSRGRSLVIAGINQPAAVHALALSINQILGNIGSTVTFRQAVEHATSGGNGQAGLKNLVAAIGKGSVKSLFILDSNPVYAAPADLKFVDALKRVPFSAHLGAYYDETGEWCTWHVPQSHPLEAWGDARAVDGTVSLIQPLIQPLYQSASANELLSALQGTFIKGYEIVKNYWRTQPQGKAAPGGDYEKFWQTALHSGVIKGTAAATVSNVAIRSGEIPRPAKAASGIEIQFRPDPVIWDGRYANLGWLQELPKPLTKLAWDNTALMSLATAEKLGVNVQDVIEITVGGSKVKAPVFIFAGHPDEAITVHLGYGHERMGRVAEGVGFNANLIRKSDNLWFQSGGQIAKTGETMLLACTQAHHNLHGRSHVREATLTEYTSNPTFVRGYEEEYHIGAHDDGGGHAEGGEPAEGAKAEGAHGEGAHAAPAGEHGAEKAHGAKAENPRYKEYIDQQYNSPMHTEAEKRPPVAGYIPGLTEKNKAGKGTTVDGTPGNPSHPSLYPQWKYEGYAWGMAIDLNSCIGCQACVVGCNSENNIAIVGKDEVLRGREMHWIRIDTYYRGPVENPEATFQPMLCQQCESAPCETVCPVEATSHSAEGINEMTYNRCIGTRYCSNNCPYKVRRFNFLQYSEQDTPQIMLMHNPEVTVRSRGVMEKCNFCVQRVNMARIESEKAGTHLEDGDVITACQQACPTDAIVFGNINDPNSRVSKLKKNDLNYGVLTELNTQPRVTYLGKVTNPSAGLPAFGKPEHDTPETPWEKGE